MIQRADRREGTVLVAVLVVVVILSLAAYHYSDLMTSEFRASLQAHRSAQVKALAESGVHYAAALLATPDQVASRLNGNPWHNPDMFDKVQVPGDPDQPPGMFTLIAPADGDDDAGSLPYRNGVSDESSKINLNSMMKLDPSGKKLNGLLVKLPNMTEEIAAAIVDWLDADSDPRTGGAENDVYSAMSPSYRCKNGPLDSLDELLLVRGVTRELLFGTDTNRNGVEDPGENTGNGFERGWSAFLTIYSREQNRDASGQAFLYLNDKNLPELYEKLSVQVDEDLAKFLVLYRQYGPANASGNSQSLGGSIAALLGGGSSKGPGTRKLGDLAQYQPNFGRGASKDLRSMFDLVGAQVGVQKRDGKGFPSTTIYSSPLNDLNRLRDLLPKLFKAGTLVEGTEIPARININTAPREVLLTLPGLTENDVQNILAARPKLSAAEQPGEIFDTLAWLATDAKLQISQLKKLEQYVTARTQVYRVQSVGSLASGGPTARVEAIIDTNSGRPRFLAWRDLTELGQRKLD